MIPDPTAVASGTVSVGTVSSGTVSSGTVSSGPEGLVRALGVRALALNAVNLTIGSGIFVLPAVVAAALGPAGLVAYIVCGLTMGLVMTCFAEAGSRLSRSGGAYAYAEAAFGPYVGFVVGTLLWFAFGVLSHAAVATALAGTLAQFHPAFAHPVGRALFLAVLIGGLAWVNVRGVRQGARFAMVATVVKLLPLLVLIAFGLPAVRAENLAWDGRPSLEAVGGTALVLFFAFAGPEGSLTASGEIRNPARTVPRAISVAVATVLAFYLALQLVAQGVLGPALPEATEAPLAEAAGRVLGGPGRALLLAGAALSMFGTLGGDLLSAPRALFAQSRDGFFAAAAARVHPRYRTPHVAIGTYAALAFGFAVTGAFQRLAAFASAGLLLIYLAVCLSALVLRRRDVAEGGVPFRAPGGPLVPVLAVGVVLWLLAQATSREFLGLAATVAVATVAYLFRRKVPPAV